MVGPHGQSERTRMLCQSIDITHVMRNIYGQRVLTCSVVKQKALGRKMEAWCCKWHPRVQKSSTGVPRLLPHSSVKEA